MYHWLLFDADNTIWDFSAAEAASLRACLSTTEIEWSDEILGIYREINREAWHEYENGRIDSVSLRSIRFQRLLDRFRIVGDALALSESYRLGLADSDHYMPGARKTLHRLRPHYKMGLITNGLSEVQRPRLRNTQLEDFFDFVLISDEVGVAKPDAAYFDLAFAEMDGARPEDALVIGDNAISDIGGGKAYGCRTCWLRSAGNTRNPEPASDHTIEQLNELVEILGH